MPYAFQQRTQKNNALIDIVCMTQNTRYATLGHNISLHVDYDWDCCIRRDIAFVMCSWVPNPHVLFGPWSHKIMGCYLVAWLAGYIKQGINIIPIGKIPNSPPHQIRLQFACESPDPILDVWAQMCPIRATQSFFNKTSPSDSSPAKFQNFSTMETQWSEYIRIYIKELFLPKPFH